MTIPTLSASIQPSYWGLNLAYEDTAMFASLNGHSNVVDYLFSHGVELNLQTKETPLFSLSR